jgi:light-independent protochlorophyllide reductase subunit B
MRETEAAELALEDLIRAHVRERPERSPYPTVNLFGPPVFGPSAAAEYAEAERLMDLIGVEVNARVPLGAGVGDLGSLPRAWANVLLYREVGESATLYLQDELGIGRVTTPMIGAAGTGAALRAVGELCDLDPKSVQRTIWTELAHTAKLPWYARLEPPEVLKDRRVAIFGDFTYPLGLGYAFAREVGLEVAACGTYLTHLEEEVADSLGIPFLPLCHPVNEQPFVGRPLMGYAGSSVLADALDGVLNRTRTRPEIAKNAGLPWTDEALRELAQVPPFLRGRARRLAEERAREAGSAEVTREVFLESRP